MSLVEVVRYRATHNARDPAVGEYCTAGLKITSYFELERRASRIAGFLRSVVGQKSKIALIAENCAEWVEVVVGIAMANCVAVPVSPNWGETRILRVLDTNAVEVTFSDGSVVYGRTIIVGGDEYSSIMSNRELHCGEVQAGSDGGGVILHSSGSSGFPKPVVLSARELLYVPAAELHLTRYGTQDIRWLLVTPLSHEAAFWCLRKVLALGGMAVVTNWRGPDAYFWSLTRFRCSNALMVPSIAEMVINEAPNSRRTMRYPDVISIGSAPCGFHVLNELQALFQNTFISHFYGTTETGLVLTRRPVRGILPPLDSVGCPVHGVRVDFENAGSGEGELLVQSERTHLNHGCGGTDGNWFRTGDVFVRDHNGFYYFKGRADDLIVCQGEKVFPVELENVLLSHPSVRSACVVGRSHLKCGEVPVALVSVDPSANVSPQDLHQYCQLRCPPFARLDEVRMTKSLPMIASGKVDRREVARIMGVVLGAAGMRIGFE